MPSMPKISTPSAPKPTFDASAAKAMSGIDGVIDMGEGIAVIADNTWIAMQAVEAVDIDWEPSLYPDTTAGLMQEIEAAFDAAKDAAFDALAFAKFVFELVPGGLSAGLVTADRRLAARVFDAVEIDFNLID